MKQHSTKSKTKNSVEQMKKCSSQYLVALGNEDDTTKMVQ